MKLNTNEALVGDLYGLFFAIKVGWWAVPLSIACGILWSMGGTVNKAYRRVGCSLLPVLVVFIHSQDGTGTLNLWPWLSFPLAYAVLCIGYGMPSSQPYDEGSALGRFWDRVFVLSSDYWANFFTRATIYFLLALAFIPVWISQ